MYNQNMEIEDHWNDMEKLQKEYGFAMDTLKFFINSECGKNLLDELAKHRLEKQLYL